MARIAGVNIPVHRPSGFAPIAYSLQRAASDLPVNGRSTVVVITGGADSCSGDPCDAAARLIKRGRADRIHIVGLDQPKHTGTDLECVGTYHAATNRVRLRNSPLLRPFALNGD